MILRIGRKLMTADAMGFVLFTLSLQTLTYGISASLRNTDTSYFFWFSLFAALISFSLGKYQWKWMQASAGLVASGVLLVWILGARLTQPLLNLVHVTWSTLRSGSLDDTTSMLDAWTVIAQASSSLFTRLQIWGFGFHEGTTINDALIRNMIWILILWLIAAWMGWFAQKRNAIASLMPAVFALALVTSYSERRLDSLWFMVVILLLLMGIWNYKNHTLQWIKLRIDYSDSVRIDNTQAVLLLTLTIGVVAFIVPSVSWQDIVNYLRERNTNEAAEMLGIKEAPVSVQAYNTQQPSLPRDHLLNENNANSEEVVMMIRTGELPPMADQALVAFTVPRYYWRSTIYDQYVSSGWVTSNTTSQRISANTPLIPGLLSGYRVVHLDVDLTTPEDQLYWSGILFSTDIPFTANWRLRPPSDLFAERSALLQADLFAASGAVSTYTADVYVPEPTLGELRSASTEYPEEIRERYLKLPRDIPERVQELAHEITNGHTNPYDKAKAIESYLRQNYPYDLNVPPPPEGRDVAEYFLFDLQKGYCDYYATSMVVLARLAGIPARFVTGYSPGEYNAPSAAYIIRELNAHSWVEIYFPNIGWVEFEPTASIPEIERTEDASAATEEDQKNEEAAIDLIAQLRRERILLWLSPFIGVFVFAILYFAFIERWYYLRLKPEIAIENMYQKFYQIGRPIAGPWTYAETPSEYLQKLLARAFLLARKRSGLIEQLSAQASLLTDLYQATLFTNGQLNKKDAHHAWDTWMRLRYRLYITRFLLYITKRDKTQH